MFTGVTLGCGIVESRLRAKSGIRLEVRIPNKFPKIKIGGSVSIDGACLTAVKAGTNRLFFDVIPETWRRTNFRKLKKGTRVNLEPALQWNDRIEGHFVQGHVDGIGVVRNVFREEGDVCLEIIYPAALKPYLPEKGSIAINGVSLTLGKVGKKTFRVHLIPHTLKKTNFVQSRKGDFVNLEADILAKFFRSL